MALRYAHVGDREAMEAAERIGTDIAALLGEVGLTVRPGHERVPPAQTL